VRAPRAVKGRTALVKRMPAAAGEPPAPDRDQIARLAYQLFLAEGSRHGRDIDHWLEAEREIRRRALTSAA
jgi:hypothetical protein